MATQFDTGWNQLDSDLEKIKDFSIEKANLWLQRHGYGPALQAEAMTVWNAKKVVEPVKVEPVKVVPVKVAPVKVEPQVTKTDKKRFF